MWQAALPTIVMRTRCPLWVKLDCFSFYVLFILSLWVISGQTIPGQNPPLSAVAQ
jgi:hypothetical protein